MGAGQACGRDGRFSVNDEIDYPFLLNEIELAKTRLTTAKPTLGICLGAQILSRAIGGSVHPLPGERDWLDINRLNGSRAGLCA